MVFPPTSNASTDNVVVLASGETVIVTGAESLGANVPVPGIVGMNGVGAAGEGVAAVGDRSSAVQSKKCHALHGG